MSFFATPSPFFGMTTLFKNNIIRYSKNEINQFTRLYEISLRKMIVFTYSLTYLMYNIISKSVSTENSFPKLRHNLRCQKHIRNTIIPMVCDYRMFEIVCLRVKICASTWHLQLCKKTTTPKTKENYLYLFKNYVHCPASWGGDTETSMYEEYMVS